MLTQFNPLKQPGKDDVLWRYINLEKLLSLVHSKALYFSPLEALGDPYEGFAPWPAPNHQGPLGKVVARELPGTQSMRVCCWHQNPEESVAMWDLYAQRGSGIAIRTTFGRLGDAILNEGITVFCSMVYYEPFTRQGETQHFDMRGGAPVVKRESFAHEREFRTWTEGDSPASVPVDLDQLIEAILVSPRTEPWITDVVRDALSAHGLVDRVRRSDLLEPPANPI